MYNYQKDFVAPSGEKCMDLNTLVDYLNEEFKLGVMSSDGKEVYEPDSVNGWKYYRTIPPKDFNRIRIGLCYDYAEYLEWYFETYFNKRYPIHQMYYIESNSNDSHSFFTFVDECGRFCIIEPRGIMDGFEGINRFNSKVEAMNFMINLFMGHRKNKDCYYVIFRYYSTGFFHVPRREFMDSKWQMRLLERTDCKIEDLSKTFRRFKFVL
jgi:hypothetical protein